MARFAHGVLMLAAVASLAACSKKPPEQLPPAPSGTNQPPPPPPPVPSGPRAGSQEDFLARVASDRIFFDTDQYNVDAQDQSVLQSQAQWLAQYPNVSIVIEGHADERGTRDYNLALGERRANAAKNYLVALGISSARIRTVSYGKERPEALGSNESAWAQNRRAVTVTIQPGY